MGCDLLCQIRVDVCNTLWYMSLVVASLVCLGTAPIECLPASVLQGRYQCNTQCDGRCKLNIESFLEVTCLFPP